MESLAVEDLTQGAHWGRSKACLPLAQCSPLSAGDSGR